MRGKKPGANVLATVHTPSDATEHPALVTHKFGRGRVAAMLLGDVWRWGLKDAEQHEDMDKAWRQMIRWLVSDVPNNLELAASQTGGASGRSLMLTARDENHQPLDNAQVSIRVRAVGTTNSVPLHAEPTTDNAGVYQAQFIPRRNGGYLASAEVRDETGKLIGNTQAGWSTDFAAAEFRSLEPNRALLEKIAQKTGGRVVELDELEEFAAELPAERAPVTERRHFPLWHQATIFLIALACFATEWFLRRRKGLP